MTSPREALQISLGPAYSIERELGGGGMSRVYLAEETAFGRRVVVKLLSPELVAGVNVDRFKREIQVAARLQHPHIVPVLTAGESDGLPFYTMPFVEGESLRARLGRGGAMGVSDAVSILRDVARALVYAHDHGIVHRDIKPDNVLLAHGTATVADFGIAKALSASKTSERNASLTQVGTSIGTPMYMAPEQAAGDPDVDHRADIYSFGCMAYEMLAGRPPFDAKTPQRLLAAHMGETPRPLAELRAETPRPLADLVMRCLEKDPARRPQSAAELLPVLESSGSGEALATSGAFGGRHALLKALAAYGIAFVAAVLSAKWATEAIGLPDWVVPATMILMGLGLPMILLTAAKASPRLTWSRTARWGAYSLGAFALFVTAAMIMRVAGIGPFATLLSAGELKGGERVIVAELTLPAGSDSTLGRVISEAIKTDLDQSRALSLLPDADIARALVEMRQRDARLLLPVAREVAQRRGLKAIVDGSLSPIGAGFVVKLRLVTTDSLRELASFTGAADSPSQLIEVVGSLTRKLRGKMGESLKSVRESRPLYDATTSSLPALRKFTEARDQARLGDGSAYLRLMEEAIALDSTFALAYANYATELGNRGIRFSDMARYSAKAFALRDRLTDRDRATVSYIYYRSGPVEARNPSLADAYVDSIAIYSAGTSWDYVGKVFLGVAQSTRGNLAAAETLYRAAFKRDTMYARALANLFASQRRQGNRAGAESTFHEIERRFSEGAVAPLRATYLMGRGDAAGAMTAARKSYDARTSDPLTRATLADQVTGVAEHRGMMTEAELWSQRTMALRSEVGVAGAVLLKAARTAQRMIMAYGDTADALRLMDQALAATPIEGIDLLDRPYPEVGAVYAAAGRADRAKQFLAGVQRQYNDDDASYGYRVHRLRAEIAMAERRWDDAVRHLPANMPARCANCLSIPRAEAYDGRGDVDSALVWYLDQAKIVGAFGIEPVLVMRRLGEIYAGKNDAPNAIKWYQRFVDAWKDAEPRLQPQVADVRRRMARLQAAEATKR